MSKHIYNYVLQQIKMIIERRNNQQETAWIIYNYHMHA